MAIHQEVFIEASPAAVYAALTDNLKFAAFTGAPAQIDATEGGVFSGFGGQITGRNVELIPNKRIVQAWRVGAWPESVYSIVRFDLDTDGTGTRLTLEHSGFPDGAEEHLEGGWHKKYWDPLKASCG